MNPPAVAIARVFWGRHRRGLTLVLASVPAAAAVIAAARSGFGEAGAATAAALCWFPVTVALAYATAVFSFGFDTDLESAGSCFPRWLFTLPVRTGELVGWPVAYGVAALAALWLAAAAVVFRPWGLGVPLAWPALLAAATVAWSQALLWWPFGRPWLRVVVGAVVGHLPATGTVVLLWFRAPPWAVVGYLGGATAAGAVAALAGVARARHGEATRPAAGQPPPAPARVERRGRGFRSAARALTWSEWRRFGATLPLLTVLVFPLCLLHVLAGEREPQRVLLSVGLGLLSPVFLAGLSGTGLGTWSAPARESPGLSTFAATRPVTTPAMASATFAAVTRSVALAWLVVGLGLLATAIWTNAFDRSAAAFWGLRPATRVRLVVFAVACLGVLTVTTWKRLAWNVLIGLSGREWLIKGNLLVNLVVPAGLALFVFDQLVVRRSPPDRVLSVDLWLVAVVVGAKGLAAVAAVWRMRRRRLLTDRALAILTLLWLVAVAGLTGLLTWIDARGEVGFRAVVLVAALIVPYARLLAVVLVIDWNRHR